MGHDGHIVDLSALSDIPHYAIPMPAVSKAYEGKLYQLSVCKELPVSPLGGCPGAAVCQMDTANRENSQVIPPNERIT